MEYVLIDILSDTSHIGVVGLLNDCGQIHVKQRYGASFFVVLSGT